MFTNSTCYAPFTSVTGTFLLCLHPYIYKEQSPVTKNETIKTRIREMQ